MLFDTHSHVSSSACLVPLPDPSPHPWTPPCTPIALAVRLFDLLHGGPLWSADVKALAVGLIEIVDIFLIAIGMYMISISLYTLFVDDTLPLPSWLIVPSLEAVKANLVSVVIAVLAVLFLHEAVAWTGESDILAFGAALAMIIAALSLYLSVKSKP